MVLGTIYKLVREQIVDQMPCSIEPGLIDFL